MKKTVLNVGDKFGRWTVIDDNAISVRKESGSSKRLYLCQCECGTIEYVITTDLTTGHSKSCGCARKTVNGEHHTRLYRIWNKMKDRCYNKNHIYYANYGGRGITVCQEWKDSFLSFRNWALNNGYADNLSIDRINNNDGYSPDNCRWVDNVTQQNNTRWNHNLTYMGKTQSLSKWSRELGIPISTIYSRISAGWSSEDVLGKPVDKRKSTKRRKIA